MTRIWRPCDVKVTLTEIKTKALVWHKMAKYLWISLSLIFLSSYHIVNGKYVEGELITQTVKSTVDHTLIGLNNVNWQYKQGKWKNEDCADQIAPLCRLISTATFTCEMNRSSQGMTQNFICTYKHSTHTYLLVTY